LFTDALYAKMVLKRKCARVKYKINLDTSVLQHTNTEKTGARLRVYFERKDNDKGNKIVRSFPRRTVSDTSVEPYSEHELDDQNEGVVLLLEVHTGKEEGLNSTSGG